MKNPLTRAGIEPAIFRFVAQHLNHCATAVSDTFKTMDLFIILQMCEICFLTMNVNLRGREWQRRENCCYIWTPYSGNEKGIERTTVCEACRVCTHRHSSVLKSRTIKVQKHTISIWETENAHKISISVFQDSTSTWATQ